MNNLLFPTGTALKTVTDFNSVITQKAVILFSSTWCPACVQFKPLFNNVVKNNPHLPIYSVDTDDASEIVSLVGIRGIPHVQLYQNGEVQDTLTDFNETALERFVQNVI